MTNPPISFQETLFLRSQAIRSEIPDVLPIQEMERASEESTDAAALDTMLVSHSSLYPAVPPPLKPLEMASTDED